MQFCTNVVHSYNVSLVHGPIRMCYLVLTAVCILKFRGIMFCVLLAIILRVFIVVAIKVACSPVARVVMYN